MTHESYDILYARNLEALKKELLAYKNEEDIWKLHGDISNSPANLAIHLCGNLNHFFGAVIGKNDYIRDRDYEFAVKEVPRDEIIKTIDNTIEVIVPILKNLTPEDLHETYPANSFGDNQSVEWVLTRLGFHFGYHLGQINYHRRMLNY